MDLGRYICTIYFVQDMELAILIKQMFKKTIKYWYFCKFFLQTPMLDFSFNNLCQPTILSITKTRAPITAQARLTNISIYISSRYFYLLFHKKVTQHNLRAWTKNSHIRFLDPVIFQSFENLLCHFSVGLLLINKPLDFYSFFINICMNNPVNKFEIIRFCVVYCS